MNDLTESGASTSYTAKPAVRSGGTYQQKLSKLGEDTLTEQFFMEERSKAIIEVLNRRLNEQQRDVVFLYYYKGFSDTEISELLDCCRARVQKVRSTAIEILRRHAQSLVEFRPQ